MYINREMHIKKNNNKTHPAALSGKFFLCADSLIDVLKCFSSVEYRMAECVLLPPQRPPAGGGRWRRTSPRVSTLILDL